jgi:indoleamine 2,3-dioxygenase
MPHNQPTFPRGFLPDPDPLTRLPAGGAAWDALGAELPKLVLSDYLRTTVDAMPPFPLASLQCEADYWRAASLLAYVSSLYVLGSRGEPVARIPATVAVPFHTVATRLGIPPILSYALQAMHNWRRIDPTGPIAAGNLTLLHNFLGGMDEEWFVTLHIEIEARAGAALRVLQPAQQATVDDDPATLITHLQTVGDTLQTMHDTLGRMTERCDPYIYYHRVRPFMFGWKDNAALPDGVLYEGVTAYGDNPVHLRGETGAQSGIIPAIDAALGIRHERDEMRVYLMEMRDYMPPRDRAFVEALEQGPSIRDYIANRAAAQPALRTAYNYAVEKLAQFRTRHIEYAALYILKPAQTTDAVGTGGTPFTFYLKKHRKETEAHLL